MKIKVGDICELEDGQPIFVILQHEDGEFSCFLDHNICYYNQDGIYMGVHELEGFEVSNYNVKNIVGNISLELLKPFFNKPIELKTIVI
jgi:hypothetical protein